VVLSSGYRLGTFSAAAYLTRTIICEKNTNGMKCHCKSKLITRLNGGMDGNNHPKPQAQYSPSFHRARFFVPARAHTWFRTYSPMSLRSLRTTRDEEQQQQAHEPQSRSKICTIGIVTDPCVLRSEYRSMAQLSCVERHAPADEPHKALLRCRPSGELTKLRKRAHTRGC